MERIRRYEEPPSYEEFLHNHLLPNEPAIIGPALTAHWRARHDWVVPTDHVTHELQPRCKPNYAFLRQQFAAAKVTVADCLERDFTDQKRCDMTFNEFADLWEKDSGRYYLKDWHFVHDMNEKEAPFYEVPDIFADDWLNEYWLQKTDGEKDDYRFSYMGGHATFTPFHADVYRSYSWSSNICGIKKWTLFPPGQEELYKDRLGNTVYDIRSADPKQFPHFEKAVRFVVYQHDGETLFVPSGWFHQVENIGATISINHNWLNACNLKFSYPSLAKDLNDVRRSIDDIRPLTTPLEFTDQCQQLLLMHSGWNWTILLQLLQHIACRLSQQSTCLLQPDAQFQKEQIRVLMSALRQEPLFSDFVTEHDLTSCVKTIDELECAVTLSE
ncbi:uncharacterized protein BYT42DRAFT_585019 [Radiomyces spectabilis]|uniref:uncharacterized protein n=1 Tax=Radiomyces spectabilis TaxID=64574 RepID=UPI002220E4C6|nr:uncharacterized protein BYT42DRAFT_585019 [Radiomyces spectabilis]KAI8369589.1 hypothetical protein BYT42DRAFT_585019 [Radiomyces spectabilis]